VPGLDPLVNGGYRRGCTIVDISSAGAKIRLYEPIAPMTRITLMDDHVGTLEASVMWCLGDMAGVAFLSPAPEVAEKLRRVLDALDAAEARSAPISPRPQFGRRTHHGSVIRK